MREMMDFRGRRACLHGLRRGEMGGELPDFVGGDVFDGNEDFEHLEAFRGVGSSGFGV